MSDLLLRCRICDVQVSLDADPVMRMAQVRAFGAAHNTHDEGVGVVLDITERHPTTA
jgi:hypothetical protein